MRSKLMRNRFVPYIVVFIIAFFLGVNLKNIVPVATVNGESIDRKTFNRKVLQIAGESVMNELITQKIIFQEAKQRNFTVSKKEVKDRVTELEKNLSKQGLNLKAYLISHRQTQSDLEQEMTTQMLVEKMFKSRVKVTDADIDNYFRQNRIARGTGAILESQLIAIRQQIYQEKLRKTFLTWLAIQARGAHVRVLLRG